MKATGLSISYEEPDIDQYKSYINFLKYGRIVKANLIPDKNGTFHLRYPSVNIQTLSQSLATKKTLCKQALMYDYLQRRSRKVD